LSKNYGLPLKLLNVISERPKERTWRREYHVHLVFSAGARRLPEAIKPLYYALAVVQITLLRATRKTTQAYLKLRGSFDLPDCQKVIIDSKSFWADLTDNPEKLIRTAADIAKGFQDTGEVSLPDYVSIPVTTDDNVYLKSADWQALMGNTTEFFKLAFNTQADQDNKAWKILPQTSPGLFQAVVLWALAVRPCFPMVLRHISPFFLILSPLLLLAGLCFFANPALT